MLEGLGLFGRVALLTTGNLALLIVPAVALPAIHTLFPTCKKLCHFKSRVSGRL